MCPVKTYDLYVSRLDPHCNRLWQVPKEGVTWNQEIWYINQPVGKTRCQDLMPTLYVNAGLSKRYTNHCVRSTVCGILDRGKFGARKIMRWSGHKSENSIKSYAHTTSNEEKKEMADFLNNTAMGKENKPPSENKPFTATSKGEPLAATPKQIVAIPEQPPQNTDETADLSLTDLLELSPEQEQNLIKELFTTEMEIPHSHPNNSVVQSVNNVAQPITGVTPKMVFSNSSVTINFNINK